MLAQIPQLQGIVRVHQAFIQGLRSRGPGEHVPLFSSSAGGLRTFVTSQPGHQLSQKIAQPRPSSRSSLNFLA
jgi:hypothetical protein